MISDPEQEFSWEFYFCDKPAFWDQSVKQPLAQQALKVSELLVKHQQKIVFAESCTGGLVSAVMARIPGISDVHCGSAVVYRLETKTEWLGIPAEILVHPGPVSELVAKLMVEGVLERTPEATMSASITGHLGPNAPTDQDGLIYVGVKVRHQSVIVTEHRLPKLDQTQQYPGETGREQRQWAAAELVLTQVLKRLDVDALVA